MRLNALIPIIHLIALSLLLVCPISATINITPIDITSSSIMWTWDPITIQNLSIDGVFVENVNPTSTRFTVSDLRPNEPHTIEIITALDRGMNTTTTAADTNIDQSTDLLTSINTVIYLFIIILFFFTGIKIHWVFYWFGSSVSLYALYAFIQKNPVITTDIMHINFFMYIGLFLMGIVLWLVRILKKNKWG